MSAIRPIGNWYSYAPWWFTPPGPAAPGAAGTVPDAWIAESLAARGRLPDYEFPTYPLEHLSTALTKANALWQHNVLGQTGIRSEHVGNLVLFAQYSAKAASLPAVLEAVWLSPEYAALAEAKRQLMLGPGASGSLDILSLTNFPPVHGPVRAVDGPGGGAPGGQVNVVA